MYVREILLKEEEKHRLVYIGIVSDWEEVILLAEDMFTGSDVPFANMKARLLELFYGSILGYERFIGNEKASNPNLKRHHFRKAAAYLASLRNVTEGGLDSELKTPAGITFAWHFSNPIYDGIYGSFCRNGNSFRNPEETDDFFSVESGKMYPLEISRVVECLMSDDSSFWGVCALYMQDLSRLVVSYLLQRSDDYGFPDLIKDQTWTDSYIVLRERLVEKQGNMPVFTNGKDFRNYIIKVCKLQAGSIQRKYIQKDDYLEDLSQMKPNYENEDEKEEDKGAISFVEEYYPSAMTEGEAFEPDINTGNPYEVAHAASIILLNSNHPLHKALIDGIEDKARILIDKAVNGMSYNDIISEQYGEQDISEEDYRRAVVKARKDYERVRKVLCSRLKEIIKKKGGACHNSYSIA
ncbi:hypothetical protein AGMMS49574_07620 [Bacteroidia bacterium]|nr:hypothetical protein AGMMS49574_07620 [Bacteroidia bacterium]